MLKIGLTGGIGSGKSTVAKVFEALGVPVYYADEEARKFLYDVDFIQSMIARWGKPVLKDGCVDRAYIASIVFHQEEELEWMNQEMHPLIKQDFREWADQQKAPYVMQEAAILFEAGFEDLFNEIVTVSASQKERLQRVLKRDSANEVDVLARMDKQLLEKERCAHADHIIYNSDADRVLPQVMKLHKAFLNF